jgi:type III restriction enzyme
MNEINKHIIRNALSKFDFYNFNNIKQYFPKINSINDIITEDKLLNKIKINFKGDDNELSNLSNKQIFNAVYRLLSNLKIELENQFIIIMELNSLKSHFGKYFMIKI